jgi:5'(3')-deoxyribonucleotidase
MDAFWEWAKDFGNGSLFRHLDTHAGAVPALERLAVDHEVVIVTAKPDWAVADTLAWIADHRLPTREVHIVGMHDSKRTVPCDVYLDDSPFQIETIHQHRRESQMCRYVRPWNSPVPGVHDIGDWEEFEELVTTLENLRSSLRGASTGDKE